MEDIQLFNKYYKEIKSKIDKKQQEYNNNLLNNNLGFLQENLELFTRLNSNGKMIRGFLINLGYELAGGTEKDYALMLSLAYEIFQTSILIHDDIIDHDEYRREEKTIHYANYKKYSKYNKCDAKDLSNSIALCIGDYGFYEANQVIIKNYKKNQNLSEILTYFNEIVLKTIHGELLDVILPFETKNKVFKGNLEEEILKIYKQKTAYYTIIGPLCLGMKLNGVEEEKIKEISEFAEKIGIAFQIQDDILGIYGQNIGKVIGSDIKENKQTILYSYTANTEYNEEMLKYYGKEEINIEEIEIIKELFKKSGAYNYSIEYMNNLYKEGLKILNNISWLEDKYRKILTGFVFYLMNREK